MGFQENNLQNHFSSLLEDKCNLSQEEEENNSSELRLLHSEKHND